MIFRFLTPNCAIIFIRHTFTIYQIHFQIYLLSLWTCRQIQLTIYRSLDWKRILIHFDYKLWHFRLIDRLSIKMMPPMPLKQVNKSLFGLWSTFATFESIAKKKPFSLLSITAFNHTSWWNFAIFICFWFFLINYSKVIGLKYRITAIKQKKHVLLHTDAITLKLLFHLHAYREFECTPKWCPFFLNPMNFPAYSIHFSRNSSRNFSLQFSWHFSWQFFT